MTLEADITEAFRFWNERDGRIAMVLKTIMEKNGLEVEERD